MRVKDYGSIGLQTSRIPELQLSRNPVIISQELQTKQNNHKTPLIMKYVCDVCGWEYDPEVGAPEAGIPAGTPWEEVPEDFVCPICGVGKEQFSAEELCP